MTREDNWQVIQAAFRCGRELQALLRTLKEKCPADEYRQYATGIAAAIDVLNVQLVDRALSANPELREKIESDLANVGNVTC